MQLTTRAAIAIPKPIEAVFDRVADVDGFQTYMKKFGIIPGVAGASMDGDKRRRVRMTDGSEMVEEITTMDRPSRQAYRWLNRPAAPFSLLVRGASAEFTFQRESTATRVTWTYRFQLTSPLAYPLAKPVIVMFRRWMERGLGALRDQLA